MNSSVSSPEQTKHAIGVCHGRLYIIGRTTRGSTSCVAERSEPSLNRWFQVNPPANVTSFFAVATLQGFIYILGGKDSQNTSRDSVQKYNPGRRSCHFVALEQKFVPLLMEVIYMLLGAVIPQISTWTLLTGLIPEAILGINFHQCVQGEQVRVVRQSRKKLLYLEGPSQKE